MEALRLPENGPWCEYAPRGLATKLHDQELYNQFGQRKLLMSEVQFLTHFNVRFIVYAGAASGIHIKYLSALFPSVTFYLVDPAPFDRDLSLLPNVVLEPGLFTNDTVAALLETFREYEINPREDVGFISDIRSQSAVPDKTVNQYQKVEDGILSDMDMQMEWVLKLEPKHAMLKFRLPYIAGMDEYVDVKRTVEYLDGIILRQIYSPCQSSETRLIVSRQASGYPMRTYDCKLYENQLYYYNRYERVRRVELDDAIFNGIKKFKAGSIVLRRAELAIECEIWREYLEFRKLSATPDNIVRLINDATYSIFESYIT